MKKLFSVLVLMLITANISIAENIRKDCGAYALAAVQNEIVQWGSISAEEFYDSYAWYFDACEEAGGNIEEPVIIE